MPPAKGITDIPGVLVGHASNYEALTGVTAILFPAGAVAGADLRGYATGTQEMDTLNPLHVTPLIHGICFAGGSAFGLEAASGVRRHLERVGSGFAFGGARVPLVPAAILFDLGIGSATVRPDREMGEAAAKAASDGKVAEGCVGAGTGATLGKIAGMKQAMKAGIGSYTVELPGGVLVSALVAVNAFGDVLDPLNGQILAGARKSATSREFLNTEQALKLRPAPSATQGGNTTLVAVATNAALNKVDCTRLAQLSQHGLVRTIRPVHTRVDGDAVIAVSLGSLRADVIVLGIAAAEAVSEAIVRAVRLATTMGGVPALRS